MNPTSTIDSVSRKPFSSVGSWTLEGVIRALFAIPTFESKCYPRDKLSCTIEGIIYYAVVKSWVESEVLFKGLLDRYKKVANGRPGV